MGSLDNYTNVPEFVIFRPDIWEQVFAGAEVEIPESPAEPASMMWAEEYLPFEMDDKYDELGLDLDADFDELCA